MTTTKNKLILRDAGGPAFECRSFNRPLEIRELKKDGYIGTLVGYAIIFESESRDMGGWREIITRGAPSASLKKADVRLLYQHDKTKVMARQSAGNLRLTEDEIGVRFEADLIDTTVNRDAYAEIKAGNVDAMSFGAPKATFKSSFEKRSDGTKIRRVSSFEVQEISVVSWAAYEDTALAAREFAEFVANEKKDDAPTGVDVAIARGRQELMELRAGSSLEIDALKTSEFAKHRSKVAGEASKECATCGTLPLEQQRLKHRDAANLHSEAASAHYKAARMASEVSVAAFHRGESAKHEEFARNHYSSSYPY